MNGNVFVALLDNTGMLLAFAAVYALFFEERKGGRLRQLAAGVVIGMLSAGLMLAAYELQPGIIFDTRSVLLGLSGLFFGAVPTLIAMAMTSAVRLFQGGAAAWTGVAVICASGGLGLLWRRLAKRPPDQLSCGNLYLFGIALHLAMLLLMFTLPWEKALFVVSHIAVPVLLIYPAATLAVGRLLQKSTLHRRTAAAFRLNEEKLRTTLNSIGDAVISTDIESRIEGLNPVAEELTGWPLAEALGQPLKEVFRIINENTRKPVESPADAVLETGRIVGLANHTLLVSRQGREIPIADSGAPIKNDQGQTSGVVLVFRDQTDERAAQRALEESRRKYAALVANLPGIAYRCANEPEWTMQFISQGCQALTGYQAEELVENRTGSFAALIHPDDRERIWNEVQAAVAARQPFEFEYRIHTKQGEQKWVWEKGAAQFSEKGELLCLEGFIADISPKKRSEQELLDRLGELARFNKAAVGRELRMVELKRQINALNQELGRPDPYPNAEE